MIDREKVVRGLECCVKLDLEGCGECPYNNDGRGCSDLDVAALELVKELLKEREPVEMTVEDVLAFEGIEEPVRVEDLTGGNYTQAAFVRGTGGEGAARYVEFTGKRCSYVLLVKDYGVRWKCWRI